MHRALSNFKNKIHPKPSRAKFISAIQSRDKHLVKKMINYKANVNAANEFDGETPLMVAVNLNNKDIVSVLLAAGANVSQTNKMGHTAFTLALTFNYVDIVKVLLHFLPKDTLTKTLIGGETPLMWALRKNNYDMFFTLLLEKEAKESIEIKNKEGDSPLIFAISQNRDIAFAKQLLKAGANTEAKTSSGNTALMLAVQSDSTALVDDLLKAGANVNAVNKFGETALSIAAAQRREYSNWIIRALLKAGANTRNAAEFNAIHDFLTPRTSNIPVVNATGNGPIRRVPIFIAAATNPINTQNNKAEMKKQSIRLAHKMLDDALHHDKVLLDFKMLRHISFATRSQNFQTAIERNRLELVKALLQAGVDKEIKNELDHTPLITAVINNSRPIVMALLAAGAHTEVRDKDGLTPLMLSAHHGDSFIITALWRAKADMEARNPKGYTALICAARMRRIAAVRTLLKLGANKEAKDLNGYTALMWAAHEKHLDMLNILVEAGANKEAQGIYKYTPLMWAAREGHVDVVKALLKAGANIEAKSISGETALMLAVIDHRVEVVEMLVEAGANTNAKNSEGKTVRMLAEETGQTNIIKYFKLTFQERLNNTKYDIDKVSDEFVCPISHELMEDPITLSTGVTYDRKSLISYVSTLRAHNVNCPVTMLPFDKEELKNRTNIIIKNLIESFVKSIEQTDKLNIEKLLQAQPDADNPIQNEKAEIRDKRLQYFQAHNMFSKSEQKSAEENNYSQQGYKKN